MVGSHSGMSGTDFKDTQRDSIISEWKLAAFSAVTDEKAPALPRIAMRQLRTHELSAVSVAEQVLQFTKWTGTCRY